MLNTVAEFDTDPAVGLVRRFITRGGYAPGDRLPPERQLTEALGIGAIAARRPDAAQAAMRRHLKSVETRLFGE